MEEIFECYFSRVFVKMDRGQLLEPHKRREMVDYFHNVITGCVQAGACDTQSGCQAAVAACIKHHSTSKEQNGNVCQMGKDHGVLYVAVKIAFDYKLDNVIVSRLLDDIVICEGTLEKLFFGALFGKKVGMLMVGWKSDFEGLKENMGALEYILDHANRAKLEYKFGTNLVRVIDYPMESCGFSTPLRITMQLFQADVLRILLRYGATVPEDIEGNLPAVKYMFEGFRQCFVEYTAPWRTSKSHPVRQDLLKSLRLLLSVVPLTKISWQSDVAKRQFREFVRVYDIVPLSRCGLEPPELKHMCRCAVRDALNKNWQLPAGIYKLNVPTSVQEYIDLKED